MRNSSFYKSVVLGQWLVPRTLTSSCDNECFRLSIELLLCLKRVLFCDVFHSFLGAVFFSVKRCKLGGVHSRFSAKERGLRTHVVPSMTICSLVSVPWINKRTRIVDLEAPKVVWIVWELLQELSLDIVSVLPNSLDCLA
jgi:hypothetical protein